jgi:elongation factor G
MDAIVELLPSPLERLPVHATELSSGKEVELTCKADGPFAALVFKTTADPFVGKLTYFRVFSGTFKSDSHVFNSRASHDERVGQLFVVRGKTQEPAQSVVAGDIGAVAKLQDTQTGDTICLKDRQLRLPAIEFPHPVYSVAVEPKSKADLDKLGSAMHRLIEEDPGIQWRRDTETAEMVLAGLGEQHIDVALERMKRKFGVEVTLHAPRVPYRETVNRKTTAEYKHKKQSGGHGQYGHVFLEIEPLPRGSGFEFGERVVGGSVPRNFVPAVEKGVREALPEGIQAGYPVVDVRVTLTDGSYHPVDSSEMAFKIASSQAFRKASEEAQPVLLEPVMDLAIVVPDQFVGDVMSDLNGKRARVQGMDPDNGSTTVHAQAPLAEVQRYSTDLRSITQGRGTFSMEFSHYEEVPAHVAQQVIAEHKKQAAAAH